MNLLSSASALFCHALALPAVSVAGTSTTGKEATLFSKASKSKSSKSSSALLPNLPGRYYGEYDVLVAKSEEVLPTQKYVVIETTSNPNLFMYRHCWKRKGANGEWFYEKGGMLAVEKENSIEVFVAEVMHVHEDTLVDNGYLTGHFDGTELELFGFQAGLGIAFGFPAFKTDADLDEKGCPLGEPNEYRL